MTTSPKPTKDEALKLALDALEIAKKFVQHNHGNDSVAVPIENAIAAIDAEQAKGRDAVAYKDSTPDLHIGDSAFESWHQEYNPAHKSDKQRARDAYAAGMVDPLVTYTTPPAQPAREWVSLTDFDIASAMTGQPEIGLSFTALCNIARAIESASREKNAGQPVASDPLSGERAKAIQVIGELISDYQVRSQYGAELHKLASDTIALLSSDAKPAIQYEMREATQEEMLRDWEQLGAKLFGDAKPASQPASEPMRPWQIMPTVKDRATGRGLTVTGVYEDVVFVDIPASEPVAVPHQYLADATRFKVVQDSRNGCKIYGLPTELAGRWVALVAAENDCHLSASTSPAPVGIKKENQ